MKAYHMTFRHRGAARRARSGHSVFSMVALFACGAALAGAGFAAKGVATRQPGTRPLLSQTEPTAKPLPAPRPAYSGLFDPASPSGLAATSVDNSTLLRAAILEPPLSRAANSEPSQLRAANLEPPAVSVAPATVAALPKPTPVTEDAADAPPAAPARLAGAAPEDAAIPAPPRRPDDLTPAFTPRQAQPRPRLASRARARGAPMSVARAEPSFFERLFGSARAPEGPAMAYAAPGLSPNDASLIAPRLAPAPTPDPTPAPRAGGGRAIYDITAQVVHMPDGTRLEAHSGLGAMRDNPNYAHLRMRGVTPPHVYNLRMREAPFHGVRAIRLLPVGGSGAIFGRAGLLAHTYMLGPGGDSNGCVSFRDYNAFLQAFLRGEVSQLVVVNSIRDATPRFAAR
jgi:hypothetical protein